MAQPLTAAVIVSLFFSDTIKESGRVLGKSAAHTFKKLIDTIREKFKAEGTEGLLKTAENDPTEHNLKKLQNALQIQMDADEAFTNKLKELVQQLQSQSLKLKSSKLERT